MFNINDKDNQVVIFLLATMLLYGFYLEYIAPEPRSYPDSLMYTKSEYVK